MTITNFKRDDGFGAQFQTILFSIIYADLTNQEFEYSPFEKMAHNYDYDPLFLEKKENLIKVRELFRVNNGHSQPTSGAIYATVENNLHRLDDCENFQRLKRFIRAENPNPFVNSDTYKNSNYNCDNYNISIHFRNINSQDIGDYGYTSLKAFSNKINEIRLDCAGLGKTPKFHFYSQGKQEQFSAIESDDIIFHLDESVEDTFLGLIFANELVMSKSSLSYCAGLLNVGIVHYLPFWHKPEPRWLVMG